MNVVASTVERLQRPTGSRRRPHIEPPADRETGRDDGRGSTPSDLAAVAPRGAQLRQARDDARRCKFLAEHMFCPGPFLASAA